VVEIYLIRTIHYQHFVCKSDLTMIIVCCYLPFEIHKEIHAVVYIQPLKYYVSIHASI